MFELMTLKVPVGDLNHSVDFYTRALGFESEFVAEEFGWAQLRSGELALALYIPGKGGGSRTPGASVDFQLGHPDPAALEARLKNEFASTEAEIFSNADGSQSLEFRDPDGNEWKILKMRS